MTSTVAAAAVIWAARRGDRYALGLLGGMLPVIIGAAFPLARLWGLIPVNFLTMHGGRLFFAATDDTTVANSAPTITSLTIDQAGPQTNDLLTVTVKRTAEGYASNWLCDNLQVGDVLTALPDFTVPARRDSKWLIWSYRRRQPAGGASSCTRATSTSS